MFFPSYWQFLFFILGWRDVWWNREGLPNRFNWILRKHLPLIPRCDYYSKTCAAMLMGGNRRICSSGAASSPWVRILGKGEWESEVFIQKEALCRLQWILLHRLTGSDYPPFQICADRVSLASEAFQLAALFVAWYLPGLLVGLFLIDTAGHLWWKSKKLFRAWVSLLSIKFVIESSGRESRYIHSFTIIGVLIYGDWGIIMWSLLAATDSAICIRSS